MSLRQKYERLKRKRKRHASRTGQRLDIQGLRMVAVLTVLANHLWGFPHGGFIGVDVFFVISGFLITGNLLRSAEKRGNVSFKAFYWNRVRRIVPAATVVLIATYIASLLVFVPARAHQVGADALAAFLFVSNWWFSAQQTDYFNGGAAVSPIQHYWSLSIEEQFYFVWPALIFLIGILIARKAWKHERRMVIAGSVMGVVVAASLGWSLYQTAALPTLAYFNTFSRVWELGVGALLATAGGALARIPAQVKPMLSWGGLAMITASLFLITEGSAGFPAPWALVPVIGASLVIASGVGGEPEQPFLQHPVSGYIGDISYSIYLVHWPIIVILGALVPAGWNYSVAVLALTFFAAVASYHFVENPLRYGTWNKLRAALRDILKRRFSVLPSTRNALGAASVLLVLAVVALSTLPGEKTDHIPTAAPVLATPGEEFEVAPLGPLALELRQQLDAAIAATEWPDAPFGQDDIYPRDVDICARVDPPKTGECTWGADTARVQIVIVGDSVAMNYVTALKEIALNSDGQIQVHAEAMGGCPFTDKAVYIEDETLSAACPARKQHAIDWINQNRPTLVLISNNYAGFETGPNQPMSQGDWSDSGQRIVNKIAGSGARVVYLAAPPADKNIRECFSTRSATPQQCVSTVTRRWQQTASVERRMAEAFGGAWVDSRPWFCNADGLCPPFAGATPTKHDAVHATQDYQKILAPIIAESLQNAGLI